MPHFTETWGMAVLVAAGVVLPQAENEIARPMVRPAKMSFRVQDFWVLCMFFPPRKIGYYIVSIYYLKMKEKDREVFLTPKVEILTNLIW